MNKAILFDFQVDKENHKINVTRSFNAPIDLVWAAWTEKDILDQWWAPKPYRAETKSLDFTEGGRWLYCMVGPNGENQWCLLDYERIKPFQHFSGTDAFCDEHGVINNDKPRVQLANDFIDEGDQTLVHVCLRFNSQEELETIVSMGFKEGFTAGLENLDQYIASQFYLRKQNKKSNKARVSTYLNFPGTTEAAFNFYQTIFKTEFIGGIRRFGDLPQDANHPPIRENLKQLVIHVELPTLGDHVIMGTDATTDMGFTVTEGNNMHINLEPSSREEAKRLFDELSAGGKVEMPIQDMFWGAYYGSFTDKFGINWMINYQPKS
jgi:uncharacterized glyoxalase superfamily protein PhnB/uncharacterized protein YndB with AHSA1/START domain